MPVEQVNIVVRKPLADLEQEIRRKYDIASNLSDVAIEADALVFTFDSTPRAASSKKPASEPQTSDAASSDGHVRKRRKRRVRNRMKTRGWDVVAKFQNSHGQSCTIYKPFYDALLGKTLKRREAFSVVREILVANGNAPKPPSVEYFLDNTLEYISESGGSEQGGRA